MATFHNDPVLHFQEALRQSEIEHKAHYDALHDEYQATNARLIQTLKELRAERASRRKLEGRMKVVERFVADLRTIASWGMEIPNA